MKKYIPARQAAAGAGQPWQPSFSPWRHGGWYVNNVRYPGGAVGCVSNNYDDKKWRIVCDPRRGNLREPGDVTFNSRDAAARGELKLAQARHAALPTWIAEIEDPQLKYSAESLVEHLARDPGTLAERLATEVKCHGVDEAALTRLGARFLEERQSAASVAVET